MRVQGLIDLAPQLAALRLVLPPETLAWRLELLKQGSQWIKPRFKDVKQRVLVLSGEKVRHACLLVSRQLEWLQQALAAGNHLGLFWIKLCRCLLSNSSTTTIDHGLLMLLCVAGPIDPQQGGGSEAGQGPATSTHKDHDRQEPCTAAGSWG